METRAPIITCVAQVSLFLVRRSCRRSVVRPRIECGPCLAARLQQINVPITTKKSKLSRPRLLVFVLFLSLSLSVCQPPAPAPAQGGYQPPPVPAASSYQRQPPPPAPTGGYQPPPPPTPAAASSGYTPPPPVPSSSSYGYQPPAPAASSGYQPPPPAVPSYSPPQHTPPAAPSVPLRRVNPAARSPPPPPPSQPESQPFTGLRKTFSSSPSPPGKRRFFSYVCSWFFFHLSPALFTGCAPSFLSHARSAPHVCWLFSTGICGVFDHE